MVVFEEETFGVRSAYLAEAQVIPYSMSLDPSVVYPIRENVAYELYWLE